MEHMGATQDVDRGQFIGVPAAYAGFTLGQWGGFYVFNPARENRPRGDRNGGECPFDDVIRLVQRGGIAFSFRGREYTYVENTCPITRPFHGMILTREHRGADSLSLTDLSLCGEVVRYGVDSVLPHVPEPYRGRTVAIYCNATRESGASQPHHLHFCLVPFAGMPVLDTEHSVPRGHAGLCTLRGASFAGWLMSNVRSVFDLVTHGCNGHVPYNLLVLPPGGPSRAVRYVVVPRKAERGGGFRPGGLEMMTGVLIPRGEQLPAMCPAVRDQVFRETTFRLQEVEAMVSATRVDTVQPKAA